MVKIILSWNIKKMVKVLNDIIEGKENTLPEWYGLEDYNKLVHETDGNVELVDRWVKNILKDQLNETIILLQDIQKESQDNEIVCKLIKAVGL